MKAIYTLLILLIPFIGFGQGWEQNYNFSGFKEYSFSYSIQQTTDEGYIFTGNFFNADAGELILLVKTDENGNEQWSQTFEGKGGLNSKGLSVQQTTDGGYIITGEFYVGNLDSDIIIIKTDENGIEQWSQTFGGNDYDCGYSVKQTTDEGYIVTGICGQDICLIKTDESGNELWYKIFGGEGYDIGYSVQQTTDGGYIVTGSKNFDVYLIKTDENGNELWSQTLASAGGIVDDGFSDISGQQTTDGGYIIFSNYEQDDYDLDVIMIKTDENGNEIWSKTFEVEGDDYALDGQQTTDGGYIVTGSKDFDVYLLKTDENGNELWSQTFGDGGEDAGSSVKQTIDGGYIICGYTRLPAQPDDGVIYGGISVYLIKTNSFGNITSTIEIPLSNTNRKLEKTVNIKGQEINSKTNQPIVEIYNDGSIEKKVIIE